jgi:hypothetical protein
VKVKIQVVIESDDGRVQDVEEVACLKRGTLSPEELGLNLAEAKEILQGVQQSMTAHQVSDYTAKQINCPSCGQRRAQKGYHTIVFRTLFGKLTLDSLRLHQCDCQPAPSKTFSLLAELLPERTAPELLYLEAKWCSLLSFGMTFDLLQEVLPMGEDLNVTALRSNLHKVAGRMETELGEERQNFLESAPDPASMNALPEPTKPPLAVALDGAYVHAVGSGERKDRWFEVVVGKSITADDKGKYLGFVLNYDEKPKRRLYESLLSQGLESGQPVTFFSDGEDTLRQLQMYLSPQSELILDWFHITMKLAVITQMRKSLVGTEAAAWLGEVEKDLESLKWHLWNGNVDQALSLIDGLKIMLDGEQISPDRQKLLRTIREFGNYIAANQAYIPDYGDRYRNGERISSAFAESAVNQLVSRRMVKQQQMHWTERGAHLLLQVRAQVMNGDLRDTFRRWYPGMKAGSEEPIRLAA